MSCSGSFATPGGWRSSSSCGSEPWAGVLPRPPAARPERHGRRPAHCAASPAQRPLQLDPQLPSAGRQTGADPGSHAHQHWRLHGVQVPEVHGPLRQERLVAARQTVAASSCYIAVGRCSYVPPGAEAEDHAPRAGQTTTLCGHAEFDPSA